MFIKIPTWKVGYDMVGARVLENTDTHFGMPHSSPVAGRGDHKIDNTLIGDIAMI